MPCGHGACAAWIQYAASCCILCNQPIGYETDFFEFHDGQLIHVHCPRVEEPSPPPSFWQRILRRLKGAQ